MSLWDVEIRDEEASVFAPGCASFDEACEWAYRMTRGVEADLVRVTFTKRADGVTASQFIASRATPSPETGV